MIPVALVLFATFAHQAPPAEDQQREFFERLARAKAEEARDEADGQRAYDERIAREKARQAQLEAEAVAAAKEHADAAAAAIERWKDPQVRVAAWSAQICSAREQRRDAIESIRQEKHYARIGGVLDLKEIHACQEFIRDADEKEAQARRELRTEHRKAMPCSDPRVAAEM